MYSYMLVVQLIAKWHAFMSFGWVDFLFRMEFFVILQGADAEVRMAFMFVAIFVLIFHSFTCIVMFHYILTWKLGCINIEWYLSDGGVVLAISPQRFSKVTTMINQHITCKSSYIQQLVDIALKKYLM